MNISFMNELALIFDRIGIDTGAVYHELKSFGYGVNVHDPLASST